MRVVLAACLAGSSAAFSPTTCGINVGLRATSTCSLAHRGAGVVGLRAADDRFERPDLTDDRKISLGTTKTSWQGWGGSSQTIKKEQIDVDPKNPNAALKNARESEDIAKYLGGSESKTRAGITGDVEFVSFKDGDVVLRLTGNFWHNRQMVFDEVGKYIKESLPAKTVKSVTIEDSAQLNGFAETSNAFKNVAKVTEEELRNKEAKGTNMYGEKLEGPAAEFRRKKLANQAKYDEMTQKEREIAQKSDAEQIQEIMADEGLGNMFSGGTGGASTPVNEDNLRPEDILKAMMQRPLTYRGQHTAGRLISTVETW